MEVSRPPSDRMLGRVLGDRYRVLSRLGEGGMGTVYLCEHSVLRRKFALKVLRPELSDDRELVERFRNEAIAASRIGQENVVEVVDFGAEEDGALYYVMEALEGRSLAAVLRDEGPLPVPRALTLLEQVCRALAAAHGSGVVHRDVKPENVFVVRRDGVERAKVLDFGISHVPTERGPGARLTRAGAIIGTPEYMAPEQASGEPSDHRADVYAVGVLAYEVLTGGLPIEGATPIATLLAAQTRAPEPPSRRRSGIPPEVDGLVLRALAKRPDERYPSMHEMAAEVARVRLALFGTAADAMQAVTARLELRPRASGARGETVAIPGTPARRPAGAGARRVPRRALLSIGVAAAVLAAAAVAGYWARGEWVLAAAGTTAIAAPSSSWVVPATSLATPTPTPASTSTPTSIPTPTAISTPPPISTPTATPTAALDPGDPAPRVLVNEREGAPPRQRAPAVAPDRAADRATGLRDPYGGGGDLKPDPFE